MEERHAKTVGCFTRAGAALQRETLKGKHHDTNLSRGTTSWKYHLVSCENILLAGRKMTTHCETMLSHCSSFFFFFKLVFSFFFFF